MGDVADDHRAGDIKASGGEGEGTLDFRVTQHFPFVSDVLGIKVLAVDHEGVAGDGGINRNQVLVVVEGVVVDYLALLWLGENREQFT